MKQFYLFVLAVFLIFKLHAEEPPLTDAEKRHYIDTFSDLGHEWALKEKAYGVEVGSGACRKNRQEMYFFTEEHVSLKKEWALERKAKMLIHGGYEYEQDHAAAHLLIEECVDLGHEWAMSIKACALKYGKIGYTQDLRAYHEFVDGQSILGKKWILSWKVQCSLDEEWEYPYSRKELDNLINLSVSHAYSLKQRRLKEVWGNACPIRDLAWQRHG